MVNAVGACSISSRYAAEALLPEPAADPVVVPLPVPGLVPGCSGVFALRPFEKQRVRLRWSEFASKLLQERRWHASQQIYKGADASPELTMDVAITPELERSVLNWGKEVEVMEPQSLRETIREHARVVMARG